MGKPIYMIWRSRPTAAFWELTEEERNSHYAKVFDAHEKVGSKQIIILDPFWSTERWFSAGVTEFPDIEALQEYERLLQEMGHDRYRVSDIVLGTNVMLGAKWE